MKTAFEIQKQNAINATIIAMTEVAALREIMHKHLQDIENDKSQMAAYKTLTQTVAHINHIDVDFYPRYTHELS